MNLVAAIGKGAVNAAASAVGGELKDQALLNAPKQKQMGDPKVLRAKHVETLTSCKGLMIRERVEFAEELQDMLGVNFFQQPNKMKVAVMPNEIAEQYTLQVSDEQFKELGAEFIVNEKPPSLFENVMAQTGEVGALLGFAAAVATGGAVGGDTMKNALGLGETTVHVTGSSGVEVFTLKVYMKPEPCLGCCKNMIRTVDVYGPDGKLGTLQDQRNIKSGEGAMCICQCLEDIWKAIFCCGRGFDIFSADGTQLFRVQEMCCLNLCGGHFGMIANCCTPCFCCAERRQILVGDCPLCAQPCTSGIIANVDPINCGSTGFCNPEGWMRCMSVVDNYMVRFPDEATTERDRALLLAASVMSFSSDFVKNNDERLSKMTE